MLRARPCASVSLDLDDLWTYLKIHGDPEWTARPSYLPDFLPLALDTLARLGVRITFFVVGFDATVPGNRDVLREITRRGHEVGNHSFEHDSWLYQWDRNRLAAELSRTETALAEVCGQRPLGFRGPGFSWSPALLELLKERGYLYDASTLPTWIGPLARAYYFRSTRLSPEQRAQRKALFGRWGDGLRPVGPYHWHFPDGGTLLEIPVTTIPVIKVPFHLSYLLYLAGYSEGLMERYFRVALGWCRLWRVTPSFLLHPLDLLGGDLVPGLRFFPGMQLPTQRKLRLFERVLRMLGDRFTIVPMSVQALELSERGRLAFETPRLSVT